MSYRGPVEYRIGTGWYGGRPKSFRKLSAAKKWAQAEANRTGKTVHISKLWDVGEVGSYEVEPYKHSSKIGSEFNPVKTVGSYDHQPAAEKALKRSKRKGGHVGFDVKKGKWVLVFPSARNPGHEYGVAVIGAPALSKAGFKTLADARGWLRHLNSRGVLAGRSHEILKIDNDAGRSEVVESKQNPGGLPKFKKASGPPSYVADMRGAGYMKKAPYKDYLVYEDSGGARKQYVIGKPGQYPEKTFDTKAEAKLFIDAQKNPLPVGRYVTVKVKRLANGRIEVYKA
jgi:hypothetical protein